MIECEHVTCISEPPIVQNTPKSADRWEVASRKGMERYLLSKSWGGGGDQEK